VVKRADGDEMALDMFAVSSGSKVMLVQRGGSQLLNAFSFYVRRKKRGKRRRRSADEYVYVSK
jgi:hypothetical protein